MSTEYLVIPDWNKLQHYKYRRPPWIKLHASWLDDPVYRSLSSAQQAHFFNLFLIASKHEHGHIPNDRKYLREVGQIAAKSIDKFINLGLIRLQCDSETTDENKVTEDIQGNSASTLLASREQDALPEGEAEAKAKAKAEQQGNSVYTTSRHGNFESAEVLTAGLNQLNKSIPSPSPEIPGRRQSRRNGHFDDIKIAVQKLLSAGIAVPADIDKIAKLAQISPKQVKEAIKQLREDGKQY